MAKPIQNLNVPKKGMSRKNPIELENTEYSFALNANMENSTEDFFSLSNEQSNLLATRYKAGFKFIGGRNDISSDSTYVFLVNPTTGEGEFGEIKSNQNNVDVIDVEGVLGQPLELQTQTELQTYTTLLNDSCNNGFNFDVNFPIKKTALKNEKGIKTIYFTDNRNEPRHIIINKLEEYVNTQTIVCGRPVGEVVCFNTDKMLIFKKHSIPELTPVSIELGGNLSEGTYQFLVAYADAAGNESSQYYSLTNPVAIFDENNSIQEGLREVSEQTNFSIRLQIEGLDTAYTHYKIAVIQNTNNAQTYVVEGLHTIDDRTVVYTTSKNKESISLGDLVRINASVKKAEGLTVSNDALFLYGLETEKEWNLQPVVNFIGQSIQWQTSIAPENFYKDGINSNKVGYNRDEVYPLSIQFQTTLGYQTPLYPLIGRQATVEDLTEVSELSQDRLSIEANLSNCGTSGRTKRWQYYNDAKETGICLTENIPTNTVTETVEKSSVVDAVVVIPAGSFSIYDTENYENLQQLIEDGFVSCSDYPFCSYLDIADYTAQNTVPEFEGDCETPTLVSEYLAIDNITGETSSKTPRNFPTEYGKTAPTASCRLYAVNSTDGTIVRDTDFETLYTNAGKIYKRDFLFTNTGCAYPEIIQNLEGSLNPASSQFHNYYGADTQLELQTTKTASYVSGGFTNKIHDGALWYKTDFNTRDEIILEVSKQLSPTPTDDDVSVGSTVRVSIYNNCSSTTSIYGTAVDLIAGTQIKMRLSAGILYIKENSGSETSLGAFTGTNFVVAIDCPIAMVTGADLVNRYIVSPTNGCFSIVTRDIQYERIDVSYTSITLDKRQTYSSTCNFEVPQVQNCVALPYKKGSFGYIESTETYADNTELYNSQTLDIKIDDFEDANLRLSFESNFTSGYLNGKYNLKDEADFRCAPIRHFKFPDNKIAPFMWESPLNGFVTSTIFPLGITIDENVITTFLNIAVKNNLITQQQRDSIVSYEIFRGDRTANKTVEASGYLYDMRKYTEDDKEKLYSNYPFNDLGADKLNLDSGRTPITHNSNQNSNFTFHSPETDFNTLSTPSELKVEGYVFGKSNGTFVDVHDHPKWVILGKKAKSTALTLAILESISELAILLAQAGENYRFGIGLSNSANPVGIGLSIAASIAGIANQVVKVGQYRYEWLKTFRDLGSPKNFAYKYSAIGHYNYLQILQEENNIVRGISVGKTLKNGNYTTTNEITGEKLEINNLDREQSTFISLSEAFPLVWQDAYKNYDNGTTNSSVSSLTYASESNSAVEGRSGDIVKNIASPYVKLKNYIPSQYGTLGSIAWINTGYRGDLKNPSSDCISIFGGDTFITRYHLKRKLPLFVTDAMGLASLTPFDYKKYTNIGREARFYCDYEINGEFSKSDILFPDFDSDYNFDSLTGDRGLYVKPPSKFYLYYYGIPGILTETTINTNYRTGRKEPENDFYPNFGDHVDWTQENLVSIKRPNRFFYNTVYSQTPSQLAYKTLPSTYNKIDSDRQSDSPNGVRYSLQDNSENSYSDPWLTFRSNDFYEFPTSYGKLKELRGIEDNVVLGRFADTTAYFNSTDIAVQGLFQNDEIFGNGGIFTKNKPRTFSQTELGFGGTQSSESISSEYGHFHVDAKRGQVMQTITGKAPTEISGYESHMRNWFKEHLPFKILKSGIEGIDADNAYNGIGISMGWDSRFNRLFLTKKDYIPLNDCIEFVEGSGFFLNEFKCNNDTVNTCPEGYTLDEQTQMCIRNYETSNLCPTGYTYNILTNSCDIIDIVEAICVCTADVFASPETICSGTSTSISLTSTEAGISYTWTVIQSGTSGATTGSGNTISQTLSGAGTATYTITPYEIVSGCLGAPIEVTVTVNAIPDVIATPNSLEIADGETAVIELTSSLVGTTFTWIAVNTGTSGATSGAGNTISQIITGEGTTVYTITPTLNECQGTPIDVVVNVNSLVISNNTEINIWFDNSGSMNTTLTPLQTMRDTILKPCLLAAYNNDSALYDLRVKVLNFSEERYINRLATIGSDPSITKVINLAFADESNLYGAESSYSGVITTEAASDINTLRNNLSTQPSNSLFGVIFQVATGGVATPQYPGFKTFVTNVHTGVAPFTGTAGLSDKTEIGYNLNVAPGSTPEYYANLIVNALNSLGFTLPSC